MWLIKTIPDADALYAYGGGSGPIHFAGFQCHGNESYLINCSVSHTMSVIHCRHREDAGVRCPNGKLELGIIIDCTVQCDIIITLYYIFTNPCIYNYTILTTIIFFTDPCTENKVQLNNGVIQVCHDGQWGLVCEHEDSWNQRAADVVCRQVGIPSRSQLCFCQTISVFLAM